MRYVKYYREPYAEQLEAMLKTLRIRHTITPRKPPHQLITFYYPEGKKMDDRLTELLGAGIWPLRFVEYTEEDREQAKFLTVFPKWNRVSLVNEADSFGAIAAKKEGRHMCKTVPIKPLIVEKEPKWKEKTAFYTQDFGCTLLFADNRVRDIIEEYHLKGVEVLPLTTKRGRVLESSFQLSSHNILDSSAIRITEEDTVSYCPMCGALKIHCRPDYQLFVDHQYLNDEQDFYMTEPIYGSAWSQSKYIISQRFYQLLKAHNLIGEVNFDPVLEG